MASVTITSLSDQILLRIFEQLDASTLKNCALVCKSWDKIIGSSPTTMQKFSTLLLYSDLDLSRSKLNEFCRLKRKIQNLWIDVSPSVGVDDVNKTLGMVGLSVRKLDITGVLNVSTFVRMLFHFLAVEELTMSISNPDMLHVVPTGLTIALGRLKVLKIHNASTMIFNCFIAPNLQKLVLTDCESFENDIQVRAPGATRFISSCKNLRELEYGCEDLSTLFYSDITEKISFKLRKLVIVNVRGSVEQIRNLIDFLESQAEFLQEVTLGHIQTTNEYHVLQTIYNKLRLRSLSVNLDPKEMDNMRMWNELKPMLTLKNLEINVRHFPHPIFQIFLHGFPRLESFECRSTESLKVVDVLHLNILTEKCRMLKSLGVEHLIKSSVNVIFENLKVLKIRSYPDIKILAGFLRKNPSVEQVEIYPEKADIGTEMDILDYFYQSETKITSLRCLKFKKSVMML